ncbi:hypothetical protein [Aureimonas sp. ME7]|uniref:hypothetical protein n=1 Tax=Aureimonas sp. ME7 TaxID=2744252 RepID=UPI0015F8FF4B|nr:hypothetical protein [Aureimonas sp. ME7]
MTAINIVLQRARALVLTDSLFIHGVTGRPSFFAEKCAAVHGAAMAVTARGDYRVPEMIAGRLPQLYADIDSLIADEGQAVRDLYTSWVAAFGEHVFQAKVEIQIVGWSEEKRRPRGFQLVFHDTWTVAEISDEGSAAPLPDECELDRLALIGCGPGVHWDCSTFDPIRHGIPLMEAQRRMVLPLPTKEPASSHIVGGHILLTEINRDDVSQRVIHEWHDAEGVEIEPAPFVAPVIDPAEPPAGMNRQQRRAWERQNRKVAA